ncbi:GNAT family N-acetyltransferase [Mucilaginibacter sp. SP1R1]|uniref:GNAT family N-acetyltransferase n=1 Tax=Mucilaginibacter sp. SP1R1 TaxID=2723091 RepID=UPI00161EE344|nr:GNAT family protein [Mucilaginibacter sp. SP1R1]MBB6151152.1 RimJ/RimL family protein N-acetyltransferase [Mucilaginibacter sp. SP1R1]
MTISVYIRPLVLEDAQTSYLWRNDPQVWTFTKFRATQRITPKMETAWLQDNLDKADQSRFAICVKELDTYIGNVQLLDIQNKRAELHLFIGNKLYWGKGIGYQATMLILQYAFFYKDLESLYLRVHPANIPALYIYEKAGFEITGEKDGLVSMGISKKKFVELEHMIK